MDKEEIAAIRGIVMDDMTALHDRDLAKVRHPDQAELFCALCAVLLIIVLNMMGAAVWTAPLPLLPNIGKTAVSAVMDLFR